MADERLKAGQGEIVPWGSTGSVARPGRRRARGALPAHPRGARHASPACSGVIFRKAQNRIQDPAKLKRLIVDLIDEENWSASTPTSRATPTRGCSRRAPQDTKSGAGQYFTPRPLIQAMVDCHPAHRRPTPSSTRPAAPAASCSPPTTTSSPRSLRPRRRRTRAPARRTLHGCEIVDGTARLCAMNLLLHGIGTPDGDSLDRRSTTRCIADPGERFDVVLANPPFGRKSSVTMVERRRARASARTSRSCATTSGRRPRNKQLNFVQHIKTILEDQRPRRGRRARQRALRGRRRRDDPAQAAARVRRPHAAAPADRDLLRPGRQGQRAVLRPEARPRTPWTEELWVYDLRTNKHFTLKTEPAARDRPRRVRRLLPRRQAADRERVETERFTSLHLRRAGRARQGQPRHHLAARRVPRRRSTTCPRRTCIAAEIVEDLEAALAEFSELAASLPVEATEE